VRESEKGEGGEYKQGTQVAAGGEERTTANVFLDTWNNKLSACHPHAINKYRT